MRANSPIRSWVGGAGVRFLDRGLRAFERILPHVKLDKWSEIAVQATSAVWHLQKRRAIRVTISVNDEEGRTGRSLQTMVRRRNVEEVEEFRGETLDTKEYDICGLIAKRISEVLVGQNKAGDDVSLRAISSDLDEHIISKHLQSHHRLDLDVGEALHVMHELAEQTYENKALTLGVLLDAGETGHGDVVFPDKLFRSKKYKALTDGYRTAYHVSGSGQLLGLKDLEVVDQSTLSRAHFYPIWAEQIARASRKGRCGLALSRHGDILVFDEGSMRFTYRHGVWQYWNHAHLTNLIKARACAPGVSTKTVGRVVSAIYRASLDVSFRRSGGLFIILRNRDELGEIVRIGDELGSDKRRGADQALDSFLSGQKVQSLSRAVAADLAALDGAVVVDNSGVILSYGAVLRPKRQGRLGKAEGSRTKAAIGASHYGLAVKISADGDITVYHDGKEFVGI